MARGGRWAGWARLHSQHHNAPAGKSNFISVPQQNTLVICNQALQFPPVSPERSAAHAGGGSAGIGPGGSPGSAAVPGAPGNPRGLGAAQEKQHHGPRAAPSPAPNTILSKARPRHGCSVFPAVFQLCSHSRCLLQFQTPLSLLPLHPHSRDTLLHTIFSLIFFE